MNKYSILKIHLLLCISELATGSGLRGKNANAKATTGVVGHINAHINPIVISAHFLSART